VLVKTTNSSRLTLLDKVNVCLQDFGDHVMHLVFDVEGKVDVNQMNRAVRLSFIEHPIMAQRLIYQRGQPRWIEWDGDTLDRAKFCHSLSSENKETDIDKFLVQVVDFSLQPMVLIQIIEGKTTTVCIKVSCVPIDGRGFLIYVERLLALYESLNEPSNCQPEVGDLTQRSTRALIRYFQPADAIKLAISSFRNQLQDSITANNWRIPSQKNGQLDKAYYCHTLPPSSLGDIIRLRQIHQLTFNDILLAAYYLSLYDIIKPKQSKPFCVLNTYDLRRYEDNHAPDRVANYSSFINTNVPIVDDDCLISAAKKVQQSIGQRKARYPGITEGPFIWPLLTLLPFQFGRFIVTRLLKHRGEKIPVFTNVGVIHTEKMRLNKQPIRNVKPFAPLEFPPKLAVTLATSGNSITLSVGYSRNHFSDAMIKQLFLRMETLITDTDRTVRSNAA